LCVKLIECFLGGRTFFVKVKPVFSFKAIFYFVTVTSVIIFKHFVISLLTKTFSFCVGTFY